MKTTRDPRPPEQDQVVSQAMRDAALFEAMIKTPAWQRYVELMKAHAEAWTLSAAVTSPARPHPEWVLGYLCSITVLTSKPLQVIQQKQAEVAQREMELQQTLESEQGKHGETRRSPQPV